MIKLRKKLLTIVCALTLFCLMMISTGDMFAKSNKTQPLLSSGTSGFIVEDEADGF